MKYAGFTDGQVHLWIANTAAKIVSAIVVNKGADDFDGPDELAFYCVELANSIWIQSRQADKD